MKFRMVPVLLFAAVFMSLTGCAKKVDPKRPIEKVQKEAASMSRAELEVRASDYAEAIRAQKAKIEKIQEQIQKMPMEKVFNNRSMTARIAEIGRDAEALFDRYRIYVRAYQEKGGDLSKVQIESQPFQEESQT